MNFDDLTELMIASNIRALSIIRDLNSVINIQAKSRRLPQQNYLGKFLEIVRPNVIIFPNHIRFWI